MPSAPPHMPVAFAGLTLQTPLIAAAGTCGYVEELPSVMDVRTLGAITTKSITHEPREGNDPWRIIDTRTGMLNAIGLANVGVERFIEEKLAHASGCPVHIFGSIAGGSIEDYVTVAAAFDDRDDLPAVELNVSCPNTDDGLEFGSDPDRLRELVREVRGELTQTRMLVKLSPNVTSISDMAHAAVDGGADGLTLINTVGGMAIDVETRKPRLSRGAGGLSGPAIHPIAVRMVREVYANVARDARVPIIGLGGVMNWQDAAELILAGATAVGIGTALFVNPRQPRRVLAGLHKWKDRQGCRSIGELVGQCDL